MRHIAGMFYFFSVTCICPNYSANPSQCITITTLFRSNEERWLCLFEYVCAFFQTHTITLTVLMGIQCLFVWSVVGCFVTDIFLINCLLPVSLVDF